MRVTMLFASFKSFLIVHMFFTGIQALSTDELKQKYADMIIDCFKDHPITVEDLNLLRDKKMPENEPAKCLFACAYRKAGMMNEKGELSVDGVNEMTKKYFSDDPGKVKKGVEFTNACRTVNDVAVNDGEKGCERAALIFKCTVEKSPQFDFV